jgi:hypothetical protein
MSRLSAVVQRFSLASTACLLAASAGVLSITQPGLAAPKQKAPTAKPAFLSSFAAASASPSAPSAAPPPTAPAAPPAAPPTKPAAAPPAAGPVAPANITLESTLEPAAAPAKPAAADHAAAPVPPANIALESTPEPAAKPAPAAPPAAASSGAPATAPAGSASMRATDGVATVPAKKPAEKRAAQLAKEAMGKDFLKMDYQASEKKLRKAIDVCTKQDCSPPFVARLHRDLGVLLVLGMNQLEPGKDEFMVALMADGTVAISPDMNTPEVEAAFLEIKRGLTAEPPPAPRPKADDGPVVLESSDESGTASWRDAVNWVSLGIQQDFMFHPATKYVCNNNTSYKCFDGANVLKNYTKTNSTIKGNEISSMGVKFASLRILAGYERLLSQNFSVGGKLGLLIANKAMRAPSDSAISVFHLEVRGNYYPGSNPFSADRPLRPYVFASLGYAETDSKVTVDVIENNVSGRVNAWKRAGKAFLGVGGGATYIISKHHGPFLEARFNEMFASTSAHVLALQLGYTVGF